MQPTSENTTSRKFVSKILHSTAPIRSELAQPFRAGLVSPVSVVVGIALWRAEVYWFTLTSPFSAPTSRTLIPHLDIRVGHSGGHRRLGWRDIRLEKYLKTIGTFILRP